MWQHRLNRLCGAYLTIGLLSCSFLVVDASAQRNPTDPATLRVTMVKTKPGQEATWSAMHRDVLHSYYKSAKWPWVSVYRIRFGEANFAVVMDVGNYDLQEEMPEADARKVRETRRDSVEWARTYVQHKLTDLSFGAPADKPAAHISVSTITIAPGKRADFIKNFQANGIPRWKKMGIASLTTWEILYGDRTGDFVVVVPIENYAELSKGTPFYRGMSEAERAQLLAGMQGVITNIQRSVGDYIGALSYVAAQ